MEHGFPFGIYSDRENWTTLIIRTLCCSQKFFTDMTGKVVFHLLSILILGNLFVDGKQNSMSNSTQRQFSFKSVRDPFPFYPILYIFCKPDQEPHEKFV